MFADEHPTQSAMKKSRIAAMRADREGLNPDQMIGSAMDSAWASAEDCESVASMRASKGNARGGSGLCEKQFTQDADRLWIQDPCGIAGKKVGSE
jgi:S-formylglutathione hydrolase FrmB